MGKQSLINLFAKDIKYTGRFLGFIKDDEFNALVQNAEKVSSRIESKATQPIMEIISKYSDMTGYRLTMAVKKIDDKHVDKKTLYISESLDMVDSVVPKSNEEPLGKITFTTNSKDTIIVQETG